MPFMISLLFMSHHPCYSSVCSHSVSTRAAGFTYLHWNRRGITYYTIDVINGLWGCGCWGWCGCREVKMEHGFLASVFDLPFFVSSFFFFFFASPEPVMSSDSLQQTHTREVNGPPSHFYYYAFCFLAHI
ncbi:hypothetical protein B0T09DRAFT_152412 [Sordaria sp. MPI-SDFR-AT-0083]|nr:hypothetical protein B0T09DRAFT_152412 [Sordaria sp. MPI-SDFR-AT-0083]